jgi:8-oxo-dGTP diphosphatase
MVSMRSRPSSRLLLLDPAGSVLLFQFVFTKGALAGQVYWATPGGAVEDGETFEQAAIRELEEETGLRVDDVGSQIGRRQFALQIPSGEQVMADERFFAIRVTTQVISNDRWTALEKEVMRAYRWWPPEALAQTNERVYPEDLLELIQVASVA